FLRQNALYTSPQKLSPQALKKSNKTILLPNKKIVRLTPTIYLPPTQSQTYAPLVFAQYISHAAHRMNQAAFVLMFRLLPQVPYIHLNNVTLPAKVIAPHTVKNNVARQDLAWIPQK